MSDIVDIDPVAFRWVLSHLPTGATVVTAHGQGGPAGMAVNSFTSVSLEPALALFCVAESSSTWPGIRASGSFCVNIMASVHEPLVRRFSVKGVDRFEGVEWDDRATGPALSGAVGWIECRIHQEFAAGDHTIVVGRVVAIEATSGVEPLVLFRGSFGSFAVCDV